MVAYKVQIIITFTQLFHDFYTNLLGKLFKMPKSLTVKDTDVVYIALLKTASLCTFVVNEI